MISDLDEPHRKAAKVAGLAYLLTFATVVFANFGIYDRLYVAGNAAATAQKILARQTLFRAGVACDLAYGLGVVVLITALYVVLEPVNRGIALLAALWRLVYASAWIVMTFKLLDALRLLVAADSLRVFEPERLQALANLYLYARSDRYYGSLMFYALSSTAFSYLWFESRYVPRALSALGVISSAWCALCAFAFIISPGFSGVVNLWAFDAPMGLFEIAMGFWLLFRPLRPRN